MDTSLVLQGMIIGLILAVPVGPLSLMCIQRSLSEGKLHGIVSGLGIATADSFYALVAFLGLTVISGFILSWQEYFRIIAGLVLLAVGIKIFFTLPQTDSPNGMPESYTRDYLSMAAIALANPMTITFLMVTLPGFGFVFGGSSLTSTAEFVGGFFGGSMLWWIVLCGILGAVRSRIGTGALCLINRVSGICILGIGVAMLVSLILPVR